LSVGEPIYQHSRRPSDNAIEKAAVKWVVRADRGPSEAEEMAFADCGFEAVGHQ